MSFPEARDRLLAKVKEDNSVIQNTEKRIREVRKMQDNYEKQIKEMSSDNADVGDFYFPPLIMFSKGWKRCRTR